MIVGLEYSEHHNDLKSIDIDRINHSRHSWIDVIQPTDKEKEVLAEKLNIPKEELERCLDPQENPSISDIEDYLKIIFQTPSMNGKSVETGSFCILLSHSKIITLRSERYQAIDSFHTEGHELLKAYLKSDPSFLLLKLLEHIVRQYNTLFNDVSEAIDKLESRVVQKPSKTTLNDILRVKKTLIYFQKSVHGNRDVLSGLEKMNSSHPKLKHWKNFRYLYQDVNQLYETISLHRDIMTGTIDIYTSAVSNNLNVIIKKMTAFGGLILVPTLITGIYGMNFEHMPEIMWTWGYAFALGLMVASVIVMTIYFKKNDWF
ncbi:magnesium/cobalt transporter CorA [Candidatus Woesearchaeota archaeon]|nr:magnesium/cobalt transporter CorA [Candidatus Woesearchaeota archaeon]